MRSRAIRTAFRGLALLAAAALVAACGSSSSGPASSASSDGAAGGTGASILVAGGHLVDSVGRTVYMWAADGPSKSTCAGACASVWPPVTASGDPSTGPGLTLSKLSMIDRSDGKTQLVYAGYPLYYFASDSEAGDTKGQGSNSFGSTWWELSAAGEPITTTPSSPATPTTSASSSGSGGGGGYNY